MFLTCGRQRRADPGHCVGHTAHVLQPPRVSDWMEAPTPVRLSGEESIGSTGFTVQDFWSWLASDLRSNTTRSSLAEFIVAIAAGAPISTRTEWDSYDVLSPAGSRIEVKCAAYRQTWAQRRPSAIRFDGLRSRTWSPQSAYSPDQTYNADVYVFALQTALDHASYDALDTDQWVFWVLPAAVLEATGIRSISMSTLDKTTNRVSFEDLGIAIRCASEPSTSNGL